ncbi:unnamed protein product [Caenorhabditis bovis]|uniref:SKP1 component POZ domain-containing protein n=1 Tax=Caenorhabditis bovis TaxID=2654633 RepID=A0A8S1F8L3_9PELO|nr:unnamed protein product [Caenorhabditis bovis]
MESRSVHDVAPMVDNSERIIKFHTRDNEIIEMPQKWIIISKTVKDFLVEHGFEDKVCEVTQPIRLEHVCAETLRIIMKWCQRHHTENIPASHDRGASGQYKGLDDPFDASIMPSKQAILFELIMAAKFLQLNYLRDISCNYLVYNAGRVAFAKLFDLSGRTDDSEPLDMARFEAMNDGKLSF